MFARFQPADFNPAVRRLLHSQAETALAISYLLKPISVMAYVLAFWRLSADMNWVREFFISQGLFSHWQVWLALAIAMQISSSHLSRTRPGA